MNADVFAANNTSTHPMWLLSSARVLQEVEQLPSGATGALTFGEDGMVLVENKRICWAITRGMEQRLTDLLCEQRTPGLSRDAVEALYRHCKRESKPLGQALVESTLISLAEVRSALERHNCEALRRLAQSHGSARMQFQPLSSRGYDVHLTFTTTELFAALSHRRYVAQSALAKGTLDNLAGIDAHGFGFVREAQVAQPVLIAVEPGCALKIEQVVTLGRWALRALDVASFVDAAARVVCSTWCERVTVVAARLNDIHYALVCTSRAAATVLVSKLEKGMTSGGRAASGAAVKETA